MGSRLELHDELIDVLGTKGEKISRVYFQAPEAPKMEYPCIRYSLAGIDAKRADNMLYKGTKRYELIVIDPDPDSEIPDKILARFPMCSMDKPYPAEGLYHTPFTLYY